jgi:multiple sugar transport system substrate-binding protein
MKRKKLLLLSVLLAAASVAGGCADGGGKTAGKDDVGKNEAAKPPEPVTLQLFNDIALNEQDWDRLIVQPVKKKFPHVTLEKTNKDKTALAARVAAGYSPDLILSGFYFIGDLMQLGIPMELDDLIKGNKTELSVFDPVALEALRGYKAGKLIGLPFYQNTALLVYNKDIFDKFGVAYPKDGMTWETAIESARKLTRMEGGVQYLGLLPTNWDLQGSQLTMQKIDPVTNKSSINNEGYKKVFEMLRTIFTIPGMTYMAGVGDQLDTFYKQRNVGMLTFWLSDLVAQFEKAQLEGNPFNWDMVTLPSFAEKPGVGAKVDAHLFLLSAQSKHKEQAFKVLEYLTTSQDVQIAVAQSGKIPAVKNAETEKNYGQQYASVKGKNVAAIFKTKSAPLHKFHVLENSAVNAPMAAAAKSIIVEKIDINTALRQAEEQINKNIETQMMKK